MKRVTLKMLAALLIAALAMGMLPALAEGGFKAVTRKKMKVYDPSGSHEVLGTLPKGTEVTVKSYSGDVAVISLNGREGLAKVSDMKAVSEKAAPSRSEDTGEKVSSSELAEARTMVTNQAAKVYKKASKSSGSVKLPEGTKVRLIASNDGWGKVSKDGAVGYIRLSCLSDPDAAPAAATSDDEDAVVTYDRKAMMTTGSCKVYSSPSSSSQHVTLEKGAKLTLLAVKGDWARVERNGAVGYVDADKLTDWEEPQAVTTAEIKVSDDDKIFSGSNEQIVFKFMVREAGYSVAAACGVVANIKYESGFKPTTVGDSGTSYGIAQWHLGRKTRLINWCNSKGYDYKTLKGQLYYLKHELKTYYPSVHNYLKGVSNTAQGAYEAGYYFCYHFEAPASRETRSVTRGNYAKNTVWNRYTT